MESYHVLDLVGEGSFGRVYKGRRRFSGQVVALKFMPKVGRSDKELRSLKREIEIMRDLRHPNIVQLFDSFETETEVVVVTEYAEGQLFQILEDDGNLPENQVREIACQLVSALYYLHSHRILHRDMKPQNILLGKSGVVKLCDFGFARAMSVSTLVLTSIKGTPLYMSPEIVEEKPYDHTADLWALGCILYELHTGTPPFYTNSIFQLVQLIVRDPVTWPDTMSASCLSFLKGLLTKDPEKRLSWPDLLHHPFVADGVLVLSGSELFSPLTVAPSPDLVAQRLKQVAEKSTPASGESGLLRKVREQMASRKREKEKEGCEKMNSATETTVPKVATAASSEPTSVINTASRSINVKSSASKQRGQISRDYDQEFPSVEIGPRLQRTGSREPAVLHSEVPSVRRHAKDVDPGRSLENQVQVTDPSRQQQQQQQLEEPIDYDDVLDGVKIGIADFQAQLTGAAAVNVKPVVRLLKVLHDLILTSDLQRSQRLGHDLKLPQILLELIRDSVSNSDFMKEQRNVLAVGEMMSVTLIYWEKHCDWPKEETRLVELAEPLRTILSRRRLAALAPLAASVLCLFVQHSVDVSVVVESLTSLLDPDLSPLPPPASGWGLYDGLMSLLLHALSESENPSVSSKLNPLLVDLWRRIGSSLAGAAPNVELLSADGLFSFLSVARIVFTGDPYSCLPLFSDQKSGCVYMLCCVLGTDGRLPGAAASRRALSTLSCQLLCFPFALDVPAGGMSAVLQAYAGCRVPSCLLQVIRTFPLSLLDLPLSLLSRLLLLCDPGPARLILEEASAFFSSTQSVSPKDPVRTASSLLSDLLQQEALWDSAVELLVVLSQVARCSSRLPGIHLGAPAWRQALTHPCDRVRAVACRLVGSLESVRRKEAVPADFFRHVIDCLSDSCAQVRRTASRAVGNWLGNAAWRRARGSGEQARSHEEAEQTFDEEEQRRWTDEAERSATLLIRLLADPDAVTRRHCCAALGNLLSIDGVSSVEEDVCSSLLRTVCSDSDGAVRQAATAALRLQPPGHSATRRIQCSPQDTVQPEGYSAVRMIQCCQKDAVKGCSATRWIQCCQKDAVKTDGCSATRCSVASRIQCGQQDAVYPGICSATRKTRILFPVTKETSVT